ncbi:MAG: YjjG family noncanonical pyrimidine nucleotidase [Bacteroidales bacterium]|nr:YjjG family noncanonical pyrimidine nucleotidase [Bacteroidales bacterium]
MIPYKHLFFDLDNTLLDFRANARDAFQDIFNRTGLADKTCDPEKFLSVFEKHNDRFWIAYRNGLIKKDVLRSERFVHVFRELGISDNELAKTVSDLYMELAPLKTNLFDHVHETLEYLKHKYHLYILTNGFAEVQLKKLRASRLQPYFRKLFIAEMVGYQKPDRRFFEYAVKSVHAHKKECLMTGNDLEADVEGARNAGIDQVYFNPYKKPVSFAPTFEINSIRDLIGIL